MDCKLYNLQNQQLRDSPILSPVHYQKFSMSTLLNPHSVKCLINGQQHGHHGHGRAEKCHRDIPGIHAATFRLITRRATESAFFALVPCAGNPIITDLSARAHSWQVAQLTSSRTVAGQTTTARPAGVLVLLVCVIGSTATTGRPESASASAWCSCGSAPRRSGTAGV